MSEETFCHCRSKTTLLFSKCYLLTVQYAVHSWVNIRILHLKLPFLLLLSWLLHYCLSWAMNQERCTFQFFASSDKEINFTSWKIKLLNWKINEQFQSLYSSRVLVIDPKPDKSLVLQHKARILYKEKGRPIRNLCMS